MSGKYCVDANVFITAWREQYPPSIFPSFWEQFAKHCDDIVLIKPIYDEIEPVSGTDDKNLARDAREEKYPLHTWLYENGFKATPISVSTGGKVGASQQQSLSFDSTSVDNSVEILSLSLEAEYQINDGPKGANRNDIKLIAYAKVKKKTVVTLEAIQNESPTKKRNYKIPLICEEQEVRCINFVQMLRELGISI